jgi:hypothetical protein
MILGMNTLATCDSSRTEAAASVSPRPIGRPSGYSEETVGRLCEVIRRRGLSDGRAAISLGISKQTLSRWKQEHPGMEDWLAMAREQFRDTKPAIVDEVKTADGRPDWRAAVWAPANAFPEDCGRSAGTARPFDKLRASGFDKLRAFGFDRLRASGQGMPAASFGGLEQRPKMCGSTHADFGALFEKNEALRAQLSGALS